MSQTSKDKGTVKNAHRFLVDLGFDSLRMVAMSLALEDAFDRPLLLNDWLGGAPDVSALTVESLCDYVWAVVQANG